MRFESPRPKVSQRQIHFDDELVALVNDRLADRDKYPETVPFRLTRMLVHAMEVSGIEGNFRSTSEAVMGMLRNNKDSVLAMLEAFVHDPLINWRLLARGPDQMEEASAQGGGGRSRSVSDVRTRRIRRFMASSPSMRW